jgi:hypothetical protein
LGVGIPFDAIARDLGKLQFDSIGEYKEFPVPIFRIVSQWNFLLDSYDFTLLSCKPGIPEILYNNLMH